MDKEDPHIDPAFIEEYDVSSFVRDEETGEGKHVTVTIPAHMAHGWKAEGKHFEGEAQLIVTVDVVLKEVIHPDDPLGGWFQEEG